MAFSGALTLTDLNDFITPSQACIKPVQQSNVQPAKEEGAASTQIHIDSSGSYYELSPSNASGSVQAPRKLETAQISLNDCLACSGCITSAESVLITMQSHEEVLNMLANNPQTICNDHKTMVLSISPQSLASLAATISSSSKSTVTLKHVLHSVSAFARSLGFEHVYDTTFARHLALLEHAREFHERKVKHGTPDKDDSAGKLPMLASACPGWVCYAEKTHPEMLPFISRTKSPQQVMGTIVKNWLGQKWGKKPDKIYHVTVMPCYDKKLEASREDFFDNAYSTRDVDCVITTGELELMMRERGWDISQLLPNSEVESAGYPSLSNGVANESDDHLNGPSLPTLLMHPGTSSGSYLHSLLTLVASEHADAEITTRQVRGQDFEEYVLRDLGAGKVLFKGARCYGFRNLQNIVRRVGRSAGVQVGRGAAGRLAAGGAAGTSAMRAKVKARSARPKPTKGENSNVNGNGDVLSSTSIEEEERPYDYIEIMACPGGCVNGGGQLKPVLESITADTATTNGVGSVIGNDAEMRWGTRAWIRRVEEAYWHDLPTPPSSPSTPQFPNTISKESSLVSQSQLDSLPARLREADELAVQVLSDLCLPPSSTSNSDLTNNTLSHSQSHSQPQSQSWSWTNTLPTPSAESLRRTFFRTSYHAVVSEVSGIQVQW